MSRWLGVLLLLVMELTLIVFLDTNHEQKEAQVMSRAIESLQMSYNAALQVRDTAMRLSVQNVVLRQDVLTTFSEGVLASDVEHQAEMRAKLYRMLSPTYQQLVAENVLQFQFHTADGHSYLRFHQPDKFGDDLTAYRPSIVREIQTGKPVKGFEFSLFAGGFRFIYPILSAGSYLGSVEVNVSFNALRESMMALNSDAEYAFLIRRNAIRSMSANQRSMYEPSALSDEYVVDDPQSTQLGSPPPLSSAFVALESSVRKQKKVQVAMSANQPIVAYAQENGSWYTVALLPIVTIEGAQLGYIASVALSPEISALEQDFWRGVLVSSVFAIALGIVLWRAQREAALRREQQRRMQTISDTMADGLYVTDSSGVITFVNAATCRLLGYDSDELEGRLARELFYLNEQGGRGIEATQCPLCRVLRNEQPFYGELSFISQDDRAFDVEVASQPIMQAGKMVGAVTVFRDVSARNAAQKEVIAARESAEQANAAKSAFLANMSHEIRTPMNGVLGMTALLQETPLNDEQADYVQTIRSSGDALLTVIDDILDYSKIEAGMMSIESAPLDLRALFKDVQRLMQFRADQKGLLLSLRVTEAVPTLVLGDSVRVRQILLNLIGNAIKFTDQGCVEVLALLTHHEGDRFTIRIEVSDTGIGIAEDKIDRLFKSFSQVDDSTTRRFGGTGLGLSISKRLAELMQGEIGASSVEGKGSVFWFTLLAREAVAARPAVATSAEAAQSLPVARILLVEDNLVNQKVAKAMLGKLGYQPDIANNGKEALALMLEHDYDLVFMDCQMPVMDGFEATRAIRAGMGGRRTGITVVALTANAMKEDQDACYAAGMTDYLSKPVQMPLLIEMLKKHLAVAQASVPVSES
jgi:PAS domain S-box-containing protein